MIESTSRYRSTRAALLVVEVVAAFGAGVACFGLVATSLAVADSGAVAAILGVVGLVGVVALVRWSGIAYAAPVAIAGLVAFDWFQFPPTHREEIPSAADLTTLLVYLAVAILIGALAAHAGRRADVTEVARSALADEQAALRRVATLVARQVPPADVFASVAREVGLLLGADATQIARYEPAGMVLGIGGWSRDGDRMPVDVEFPLDGESVCSLILGTRRPARVDDYDRVDGPIAAMLRSLGVRSSVGAPIVVDRSLWGVVVASSKQDRPLPASAESRIAAFTEIAATAISNADARDRVQSLAEEHAALRRVATLVARNASPEAVFAAVAREVGMLLGVEDTAIVRYESDGTATVLANWGERGALIPRGHQLTLDGERVTARVRHTGRPAGMDDLASATGPLGTFAAAHGIRRAVGSPITVDGRLWGAVVAGSRKREPLPVASEERIGEFTVLAATAISNIEAREALAVSRARIVAAADDERRRVVRDLHDGAQQRLVHTVITLKLARQALDAAHPACALVDESLDHARRANGELRELAHGILPSVLTRGGLRDGVTALASRMPVPVEITVPADRYAPTIEATAYFVVAEALTNAAKHARARHVSVRARVERDTLEIAVEDDGVGGARVDGTGLVGIADRVAALDGRLRVESPPQGGTLVAVDIPIAGRIDWECRLPGVHSDLAGDPVRRPLKPAP